MGTKVIKGGTVVTADRTYEADVLIEGEKIKQIGLNLKGDEVIDASGAYVIPGGIDPHTHLEMPFMGTTAAETLDSASEGAPRLNEDVMEEFYEVWQDFDPHATQFIKYSEIKEFLSRSPLPLGFAPPRGCTDEDLVRLMKVRMPEYSREARL